MTNLSDSVEEIWKDIPGYEGSYQVSNFGRVKSLSRILIMCNARPRPVKEKIRKEYIDPHGYCRVTLHLNSREKTFFVHTLVAITFILNPDHKPEVNHMDGVKLNNNLSNLEWCTGEENNAHAQRMKLRKPGKFHLQGIMLGKFNEDHNCSLPVEQLDLEGNLIRVWPSIAEVERKTSCKATLISRVCRKKRRSHRGFIWRYHKKQGRYAPLSQ